jgi:uncharacterized membrane protein
VSGRAAIAGGERCGYLSAPCFAQPASQGDHREHRGQWPATHGGVLRQRIAITITIMVLELKVPHEPTPAGLLAIWPTFASYALSFLLIGVYWVNHHRLMKHVRHASHGVLWWTLLLPFFLSLIPFATAYMGENHLERFPTAVYGVAMLLPALTYWGLHRAIVAANPDAKESRTLGGGAERKNAIAIGIYGASIALAFVYPALTLAGILLVGIMYFLPNSFT